MAARHISRFIRALFLIAIPLTLAQAQDFKKQVIYQIVTDRFNNGDASNDNPPQSSGLFDSTKTNWRLYWGGDFAASRQSEFEHSRRERQSDGRLSWLSGQGLQAHRGTLWRRQQHLGCVRQSCLDGPPERHQGNRGFRPQSHQ